MRFTINEAYDVVKQNRGTTEPEYERVSTQPSRDPTVHVTINEAYNVVKQNRGATEAEYEIVCDPRSIRPSHPQPSQQPPPDGDYEPL